MGNNLYGTAIIPVAASSISDEMLVEWPNVRNNHKYTKTEIKISHGVSK